MVERGDRGGGGLGRGGGSERGALSFHLWQPERGGSWGTKTTNWENTAANQPLVSIVGLGEV